MTFFLLLLFVLSIFIALALLAVLTTKQTNKNTLKPARVRRLHQQVDKLLETLGLKADGQLPDAVAELVRNGRKIEAIKRYRELTGVGLKEASDAVEGQENLAMLERKLDRVLRELALNGESQAVEASGAVQEAPVALANIETLVSTGQLIPAIKRYKEMTGCSLLEAKETVEQIQLRQQDR